MPVGGDDDAQGALTAGFDVAAGRFAEDRDVGVQPVGQLSFDAAQTVCGRFDFLAVVEHQRQVAARFVECGGQMQEHRVAGLHVDRAAAVQLVAVRGVTARCRRSARCRGGRPAAPASGGRDWCGPAPRCRCGRSRNRGSARAATPRPRRRCGPRAATRSECRPARRSARPGRLAGPAMSRSREEPTDRATGINVSRLPSSPVTSAAGIGLATVAADGTVLDTWFPEPGTRLVRSERHRAAVGGRGARRSRRAGRARRRPRRRNRVGAHGDRRARRQARRHLRRLPATASALAPPDRAARRQPRRHLRRADERGVDELRTMPGRRLRDRCAPGCASRAGDRLRRRQVPANGRLRDSDRGAHRRRRPGAARAPIWPAAPR